MTHVTAPTVTTGSASNITTTSFDMGGNITNTGGANATERGFCYVSGAGGTPTTADSTVSSSGSFGTGAYTYNISGLASGTTYSVRAYAINSGGTGYGSTVEVTTTAQTPPTVVLNTADSTAFGSDNTPTVEFTGTDANGEDVRYNIQIDSVSSFDSAFTSYYADESNGSSNSGFTNPSNVFDGSTGTYAEASAPFSSLSGDGTSGTISGTITSVEGRTYLSKSVSGGGAWTTWQALTAPTEGWSTTIAEDLTFIWYDVGGGGGPSVQSVYFEIRSPANQTLLQDIQTDYYNSSVETYRVHAAEVRIAYSGAGDLLDKVSGTDAGFANTVTGGDTDPFNSGEKASFTVQAGDALSNGTWYWRVRGIDPSGSNTYGDWATTRQFSVSVAGSGWSNKVNGVTSPAEVNSVANANITSVNGVT